MKRGIIEKIFILFISIFIIAITIFLSGDASNTVYKNLFLLPLIHGIIMIIFFPKTDDMLKYVGQKIIYILFFLRNVVTPLLLPMNNYKLGIIIKNQADIDFSIFLMLYETFMVFLVLTQKFRLFKGKESTKKYFLFL